MAEQRSPLEHVFRNTFCWTFLVVDPNKDPFFSKPPNFSMETSTTVSAAIKVNMRCDEFQLHVGARGKCQAVLEHTQ